ncbi:682_t:CDS:2 [Racocetra persica]|uniref:682_t:CDS:1 n=1 Tax=Racocetra persica TaxID=160502 RepID=A0ACA9KSL7_9GLOM|nr:682_t:CDS:2 [Racocetra persica]
MNSIQHIQQVEELIKEYLLFRGFSVTFRSFETECRNDRDKGFHAEKIIEELYSFIANSDINGLLDYWEYLNIRYFSRLDARYFGSVKKFKISLLRYYLVYATQQKRKEKVLEFFDMFETELNGNPEWSKWFDRFQRRALETEVQTLHNVIVDLKSKIEHCDSELANLRQTVVQSHELLSPQRYAKSLLDQKNKDAHSLRSLTQLNHNGTKSPETFSDGRSMTSISEFDMDETQKLLGEDIN